MPRLGQTDKKAIQDLIEAALPWLIQINPFPTAKSNIGWNNIAISGIQIEFTLKYSDSQQNNEIAWDVLLAKGTWTIEITHLKSTDRGIYSVQLDGVEKGTIDGYASSATENIMSSITGITIPATKKIELKLKMKTKNNSSTAYMGSISIINLIRTE
jgi:hypothetical protein